MRIEIEANPQPKNPAFEALELIKHRALSEIPAGGRMVISQPPGVPGELLGMIKRWISEEVAIQNRHIYQAEEGDDGCIIITMRDIRLEKQIARYIPSDKKRKKRWTFPLHISKGGEGWWW